MPVIRPPHAGAAVRAPPRRVPSCAVISRRRDLHPRPARRPRAQLYGGGGTGVMHAAQSPEILGLVDVVDLAMFMRQVVFMPVRRQV